MFVYGTRWAPSLRAPDETGCRRRRLEPALAARSSVMQIMLRANCANKSAPRPTAGPWSSFSELELGQICAPPRRQLATMCPANGRQKPATCKRSPHFISSNDPSGRVRAKLAPTSQNARASAGSSVSVADAGLGAGIGHDRLVQPTSGASAHSAPDSRLPIAPQFSSARARLAPASLQLLLCF